MQNSETKNNTPEIFEVWSDEIKDRFDCFYYKSEARQSIKKIISGKYPAVDFGALMTDLKNGVEIRCYSDEGFRYLRVTDLGKYGLNNDNPRYVVVDAIPEKIRLSLNDFLVSRSGSLGFVQEVNEGMLDFILSSHIFRVSLNVAKIMPAYLETYLRSPFGQFQFFQKNNGGIVPEINQNALKSIKIILPSVFVQNKIVEKIQSAYEQRKNKEAEAEKLLASIDNFVLSELGIKLPERGAENIFHIWSDEVEGRLDPICFHPIRRQAAAVIKKANSQVLKLRDVVKCRRKLVKDIPENMPYVGMENIISNLGEYTETNAKESIGSAFVFKKGDVLFPKLRPYLNKVFYADFDGICSTEFHVFEVEKCDSYFLFSFLTRSIVVNQTSRLMTGNTLPRLQTEDIENLLIPIPNKQKQEKIVAGVKAIYKKAKQLRREAESVVVEAQKEAERMILG